jgi:uncharacterized protein YlaN (UPF0358 family)
MGDNAAIPRQLNPQTGAIVYHGSPHKFDKFDSSKIGTGEGAQAYGHGLYLAESPGVARDYQRKLSDSQLLLNGKPFADQYDTVRGEYGDAVGSLLQYAVDNGLTPAKQMLRSYIKDPSSAKYFGDPAITEKSAPAFHKALKVLEDAENKTLGNLYKVDLPDEHIAKMLDWDKPLSQQAAGVQQAVARLGITDAKNGEDLLWKLKRTKYDVRAAMQGNTGASEAGLFASTALKEQGIPGVRYLDGGSRAGGTGTSNYVLFPGNEDLLKILERNGIPVR